MKTIYSLQEFRLEVLKMAEKAKQTYTSLEIDVNHDGIITFKAYIATFGWTDGRSMEVCLQNLKDKIEPPIKETNNNVDVEIDIPEPIKSE